MKKRVLSAILALCIFIPVLCYGKTPYGLFIFILSLQGMKEIMNAVGKEREVPLFIQCISYLLVSYLTLSAISISSITALFDFRLLSSIVLLYLIPVIIYQDEKTYGIIDAFFMIGLVSFLGLTFTLLIVIRNMHFTWLVYLFFISIFTDTYAYLTGKLIGRHKCTPKISPNKTWEGCMGGTLIGVFIATTYFITVVSSSLSLLGIALMTLFLSVIGQFGDLTFSSIKRKFKIKDFSNFMPGHGGILDRFDSIFFIEIAFTFFIQFL